MQWSDLPLHPSERMLRQFSVLWAVLLSGLAAWHGLVHHESRLAAILIVLAVAGTPGVIAPKWMRPVFIVMTVAGYPIGWVVSRVQIARTRSAVAAAAISSDFVLDSEACGARCGELFQAVLSAWSPSATLRWEGRLTASLCRGS
jgi:hypothetical protein